MLLFPAVVVAVTTIINTDRRFSLTHKIIEAYSSIRHNSRPSLDAERADENRAVAVQFRNRHGAR